MENKDNTTFKQTKRKSGNMKGSELFGILKIIRKIKCREFVEEHDRLFKIAKESGDYAPVTAHYYSVMSSIVERAYGTSLHFCPPDYKGQSLEDSVVSMHKKVSKFLNHSPGKVALDVGCGIGGMMRDVARFTGGKVVGITLGENEVKMNNDFSQEEKLEMMAEAIQGDFYNMFFSENTFDSAYAIYSLKYFIDLKPVFKNMQKILKKGGLFLIYDIVRTEKYDETNNTHREVVQGFEYACGMPPLHTNKEMIELAEQVGLKCVSKLDLAHKFPWSYHFSNSMMVNFFLRNPLSDFFIKLGEIFGILPKGFLAFNKIFVKGTVNKIVDAAKLDILSGSNILIFQKD